MENGKRVHWAWCARVSCGFGAGREFQYLPAPLLASSEDYLELLRSSVCVLTSHGGSLDPCVWLSCMHYLSLFPANWEAAHAVSLLQGIFLPTPYGLHLERGIIPPDHEEFCLSLSTEGSDSTLLPIFVTSAPPPTPTTCSGPPIAASW